MNGQSSLFDAPAARHTDPPTSHAAATKHARKAVTNRLIVLSALSIHPDSTCHELAPRTEPRLDYHETVRRMSELWKYEGLAVRTGQRVCRVSGGMCGIYRITSEGVAALMEHGGSK